MPTRIKCDISYKVNMGNFETIGFDFGIEEDVPEGVTRTDHFDKCFNWVWNRLEPQVDKARAAAKG